MLHWRHKSDRRRHKLWAKLVACSFGMHLIFLILLFVGYRDTIKLTFSMSRQMLPKKTAQVSLVTLPALRRATRVAQNSVRKPVVCKPVAKKTVRKVTQKKKIIPKKKLAQTKPKQKPQPKKVAQPTRKIVHAQKTSPQASSIKPKPIQGPIALDTKKQADDYMMQQFAVLQQELVKHWQPPIGVGNECACAITAQINREGKIEGITIDDSSGVLMFDVAARTAMLAMNLPKWTWGKALTITFKP